MFTSVNSRAASAYHRVSIETGVASASPHQLVEMLFDALLTAVASARVALSKGDISTKGRQIGRAIRFIDEGLKPSLDLEKGGDLAANLNGLYGYCALRLTEANLKNDDVALADVMRVIETLADGWKKIGGQVAS
jgi:flagellar protein FliS